MPPWDFTGMDFDDIADMPSWALLQLPLDENCEFILEAPEEDEEVSHPSEIYDADDEETYPKLNHLSRRIREIREEEGSSFMQSFEPTTSAELHKRICEIRKREAEEDEERNIWEQHSQARDSERPNFLSECPDYSQESSLRLDEPPPRIDFSGDFGRIIQNNVSSLRFDRLPPRIDLPGDFGRIIQNDVSSLRLDRLPPKIDFSGDFGQIARTEISSPMPDNDDQNSDNSPEYFPELYETSSIRESIVVTSNRRIRKGIPKLSATPHRTPRIGVSSPAIHHDLLVIADNQNGETTSMLVGFETMNVDELISDYENSPKYYPIKPSISHIEGPKHFDLEPHWFHDTSKRKCWCYHCIEYRKIQSTGKQPETHDFNKWCLCTDCMEYWHEVLAIGYVCNCPNCKKRCKAQATLKESDVAQAVSEEKEALATLQNQLQSPPTSQESQEPQQTVDASTQQQSLPNTLCSDATTAASESQKLNFELFDIIRENLTFESESESESDSSE
ncbi:hypothetical protein EYC80_007994 [Monilinia laxa]|uniref:Uncharacterized protein n=1 Tax=Monilinia laxa TaxID=61186 RepID=A0A5N6JT46_MONLA|nr:hypothetical protein EYC80_007994 [Monilinia laxa]